MISKLELEEINELEKLFPQVFVENSIVTALNSNPFTEFYVLTVNNEIIGFINFDVIYDRAELININIKDEYQGHGYGKQLIEFMINMLEDKVSNITLEVKEDNIKAIKLYEKYNFKKKAVRKNYYNGKDGYLMERE